jgi:hypothetical protein
VQPVQGAIERLVAERAEVGGEDIGQRRASNPVRHRMFRGRAHQPVQRHDLGEQPRAPGQARVCEDRIQGQHAPHLMADVNRTGFANVFGADLIGMDGDDVIRRSGLCMRPGRAYTRRQ